MFSHAITDHAHELPRALQQLLAREQAPEAESVTALPRRSFLKLGAASGFALGVFPLLSHAQGAAAAPTALKPTQLPGAFVAIATDGTVTVTVNRLEFGQGVLTALPMVLAEELDADWRKVRSQLGTNDMAYADPLFGMHLTGGSNSIKNSFTQYRELGARARAMLVQAASVAAARAMANWPMPPRPCPCRPPSPSKTPSSSVSSASPPPGWTPPPKAAVSKTSASTCAARASSPPSSRARRCSAPG